MKLYPFEVPEGMHPNAWMLLAFGLSPDQLNRLAVHLFDDLGVSFREGREEVTFSWSVGLGDREGRVSAEVGDRVDVVVSEWGAVRLSGGALPPGVRLDKSSRRLVGVFTHTGLYSVTVTVGAAVKYDPLGSPGGPGDPGVWIPVDQPRQKTITRLDAFPATVADLSDLDRDLLLAELLAHQNGQTIEEADRGD